MDIEIKEERENPDGLLSNDNVRPMFGSRMKFNVRAYVDAHTVYESWGRDHHPLRGAIWPI